MIHATTKPLPANLPPLPPVPDGYDRWEYKGKGYYQKELCIYACPLGNKWVTSVIMARPGAMEEAHYIVAVKRPAKASAAKKTKKPAPPLERDWMDSANPNWETGGNSTDTKTKKPERKAGRVVAKLERCSKDSGKGYYVDADRYVLPADAASVERMANQVAEDVVDALFLHGAERLQLRDANEKDLGGWCRGAVVDQVKAHALAAIGIAATGKGARK